MRHAPPASYLEAQPSAPDNDALLADMRSRRAYLETNRKALFGAKTWMAAAARYSSLANAEQSRDVMMGRLNTDHKVDAQALVQASLAPTAPPYATL